MACAARDVVTDDGFWFAFVVISTAGVVLHACVSGAP